MTNYDRDRDWVAPTTVEGARQILDRSERGVYVRGQDIAIAQSTMRQHHWDQRFLSLAAVVAEWSKDPSTKVGAVIVDDDRRILGLGYNGFPRGVKDTPELYEDRDEKYPRVIHAEVNALVNATANLVGATIYCTHFCCSSCAGLIIQKKLRRVVTPPPTDRPVSRYDVSKEMFEQAGVRVAHVEMPEVPPITAGYGYGNEVCVKWQGKDLKGFIERLPCGEKQLVVDLP